jgi:3-oxoacyl-[acyl-carrier protein] reductase
MPRLTSLSRSIAGKTALVTGGASGMGRATALLFGDEGATVAVADRNGHGATEVAGLIEGAGGRASAWTVELADPDAITALIGGVVARHGTIDILVNNAGLSMLAPVEATDYEDSWATTMAVNLTAQIRLIRACLPHLREGGEGRVVNIASTEGLGATAAISPYTTSKHAVIGLTRSLAVELGASGVTVNCVCPGCINTAMTAPIPEQDRIAFARRRVPLRRYGDPEEVAHATLSLALPAASYINGAVLVVDGGMTVKNT